MRCRVLWAFLVIGLAFAEVHVSHAASPDALGELVSPCQQYELKLKTFYPTPRQAAGVLLRVSINGRRPLRMLLDSGAELLVIGAKDARSAGLSASTELDLVGLKSHTGKVGRAEAVEIGPLSFHNCPVAVMDGPVVDGADGVIPLSLFSQFMLRLDLPSGTLGLIPYPRDENPSPSPTRGVRRRNPLLVPAVLNGTHSGYALVDTGAYCSAICNEVARTLGDALTAPEVRVAAATGASRGQHVGYPVHFAIGAQDLVPDDVVAVDLSNLTRHYGVEIVGVLGFPVLIHYVLSVDYRNERVKIEPPQSVSSLAPLLDRDSKPVSPLALR